MATSNSHNAQWWQDGSTDITTRQTDVPEPAGVDLIALGALGRGAYRLRSAQ
jgi:hypothetical protein